MTSWGRSVVIVWDTSGWTHLHALKVKDYFPEINPLEHCLSLSEVCSDTYVVVNANTQAKDKKKYNSSGVYKITSGKSLDRCIG